MLTQLLNRQGVLIFHGFGQNLPTMTGYDRRQNDEKTENWDNKCSNSADKLSIYLLGGLVRNYFLP